MPGPVIGVDIGGTYIKAGVVDERGRLGRYATVPTPRPGEGGQSLLETRWVVRHLCGGQPPATVGLAVPGIVDEAAGMARWSANLGWRDFPVQARAERDFECPVVIGQDVRAAGLAEHRLGASGDPATPSSSPSAPASARR